MSGEEVRGGGAADERKAGVGWCFRDLPYCIDYLADILFCFVLFTCFHAGLLVAMLLLFL